MNRYLLVETAQKQIESHMDDQPFETYDENEAFVLGLCKAFNALNRVPAADVRENVRGEWSINGQTAYTCSNCGTIFTFGNSYRFCPWCGAKMRKEGNTDGVE